MRARFEVLRLAALAALTLPLIVACLELDDREVGVGSGGGGGAPGGSKGGATSAGSGGKATGGGGGGGGAPSCKAAGAACTASSECCNALQCIGGKCSQCSAGATYCPPRNGALGSCFSGAVDCSTVVVCANDNNVHACSDAELVVDCDTGKCPCKNKNTPVFCAATSAYPDAGCWPADTVCSTRTECPDGGRACVSDAFTVNCADDTCECLNPNFPVFCPENANYPHDDCWSENTVCATATLCDDGKGHSCFSADESYDCATLKCVPSAED